MRVGGAGGHRIIVPIKFSTLRAERKASRHNARLSAQVFLLQKEFEWGLDTSACYVGMSFLLSFPIGLFLSFLRKREIVSDTRMLIYAIAMTALASVLSL